jgi:hypothetical protein
MSQSLAFRVWNWYTQHMNRALRSPFFTTEWSDALFVWFALGWPMLALLPLLLIVDLARFFVHCSNVNAVELANRREQRQSERRSSSALLEVDQECEDLLEQLDEMRLSPQERQAAEMAIARKRLKGIKEQIDG